MAGAVKPGDIPGADEATAERTRPAWSLLEGTAYFACLVALCEPTLRHPDSPWIPTSQQVADRLYERGLIPERRTADWVDRRLDDVRAKLPVGERPWSAVRARNASTAEQQQAAGPGAVRRPAPRRPQGAAGRVRRLLGHRHAGDGAAAPRLTRAGTSASRTRTPAATRAAVTPSPHHAVPPAKSPRNNARTPSTTCLSGLTSDSFCSQPGASVIGSRIPDSSSTGIATMLSSGASASSLFSVSATAYDSGRERGAEQGDDASAEQHPADRRAQPERQRDQRQQDRLHEQHDHVAQTRPISSAVRGAGRDPLGSMTPARYSAISPKPTNSAPKMPSWTSRSRARTAGTRCRLPSCAASGLSSGPNRTR